MEMVVISKRYNMNIEEFLTRGVSEVIVKEDLEQKLKAGKPLRIKYGVDPTSPDIHLGHAVGLRKLRELQDAGHTIIFLIGDYTTKIGDPSGRNTTRPILTDEEIQLNAKTYFEQVGKILDIEKAEIRYNSEWFSKMTFSDILKLTSQFTAAQIIERDDFAKRLKEGSDIGLHELLYPLMQAYDSVILKADVEFGGTDQKFNMLAGRVLQKKMGQVPQDVITVKLLVGLDGKIKMSKSVGNYIALTDSPKDMFGKIMSIPDELIVSYYELCTNVTMPAIKIIEQEMAEGKNPKIIKMELAKVIIETYYSAIEAEEAEVEFNNVFSKGQTPADIETIKIVEDKMTIVDLIMKAGFTSSRSEARRIVEQGGISINGEKITSVDGEIAIVQDMVLRAGKLKFAKITK